MKTKITAGGLFYLLVSATLVVTSCNREDLVTDNPDTSTSSTIAVRAKATTAVADTVYMVQPCRGGSKRGFIAAADLPSSVTAYLATNYPGHTFHKAFTIKSSSGTVIGYVAIVYYNDKPAGIHFDNTGVFIEVLEQREKGDLEGRGWPHNGHFDDRFGIQKDTITLSVPSPILLYITANYAADTLVKAFKNRDSSYILLSKSNSLYAPIFDGSGSFVKRTQLPSWSGNCSAIEQSALPATVLSYLNTTYPNYTFKKAFSISANGTAKGYVVMIDANNTKYVVEFDTSGNVVAAKTIY